MSPIVLSNDPKLSLLKNDFEICKQTFVENIWLIHSMYIITICYNCCTEPVWSFISTLCLSFTKYGFLGEEGHSSNEQH